MILDGDHGRPLFSQNFQEMGVEDVMDVDQVRVYVRNGPSQFLTDPLFRSERGFAVEFLDEMKPPRRSQPLGSRTVGPAEKTGRLEIGGQGIDEADQVPVSPA